ncbi:MAG: hypothetical protein GYA52_03995 [Chloroflexi bacterium]|nr:hypothetical protein [Chloroflexota bacterium]
MGAFYRENTSIFYGLYNALLRTQDSSQNLYQKVLEAQQQFFINQNENTDGKFQDTVCELLDEALHKFYIGSYILEQLWGVHDFLKNTNDDISQLVNEQITSRSNSIEFLLSILLDQSLYSWRSFLDYYFKYLLFFITGKYILTMSTKEFWKIFNGYIENNPEDEKAKMVLNYIKNKVLHEKEDRSNLIWGDLLKSLRDKTTHQKLIKPTVIENENRSGFIISWPTIAGQNYSELVQCNFENNAFYMFTDLFPFLYGFDWVSGPFRSGMFKKT